MKARTTKLPALHNVVSSLRPRLRFSVEVVSLLHKVQDATKELHLWMKTKKTQTVVTVVTVVTRIVVRYPPYHLDGYYNGNL